MRIQLSGYQLARTVHVELLLRRCQQRGNMLRRDYKADQLSGGDHRDVHSIDSSRVVQRRAARRAAVHRAGIVDALLESIFHKSVRNAFRNRQTEIQWKTD